MNYQIIETEQMGVVQQHIIIDRGDGSFESFPVDKNNPRYKQWLLENSEEN